MYLFGLILAMPLGFIMRVIRNPFAKLCYSLVAGLFLIHFVYGVSTPALTLGSLLGPLHALATYGLLRFVPRKHVGWTVVVSSLAVASVFHAKRLIFNYGNWDTGVVQIFMIQVICLSYIGWDYSDGADPENKSRTKLTQLPGLFEYMAAVMCPTQVLAGPSSHFIDFHNYVYGKKEYAKEYSVASTAAKRIVTGIVWLGIYASIVNRFPMEIFYSEKFYNSDFFTRLFYFMIIGTSVKARYYGPFKLIEAAVVFSGQAFNGYDESKQPTFDKVSMINIYSTELSVFLRGIIEEWHKPAQIWLKECVHSRLHVHYRLKNPLTFLMSAIWHGFYPLYFFSFTFYYVGTTNFNFIYKMFITHKFLRTPLIYVAQSYYCL
eukprot:TRINITY_DN5886_c0_g1_i1.p1 TRINITY_DN5886_c0_g1~~TRINITY_DN5886_c0_g1_i1.p1  ORF type:complete len:377 (-),score=54.73 TRINITY_DN5886_c0_g1_i1:198-1328(-)